MALRSSGFVNYGMTSRRIRRPVRVILMTGTGGYRGKQKTFLNLVQDLEAAMTDYLELRAI